MKDRSVDKVFEYKNVQVIYMVDYDQFDCVIDPGFKLTIRQRLIIKDLVDIEYNDRWSVRRLVSDIIHKKFVDIKTYNSKKFYGIYEAEIFMNGVFINDYINKQITKMQSIVPVND